MCKMFFGRLESSRNNCFENLRATMKVYERLPKM